MKIIGIIGSSGSGKTTFSNLIGQKRGVGVIHVDDLVGTVKEKYFKFFLQDKKNNTTETTKKNPKLKPEAKLFFYRNKALFNMLMKIRSILVYPKIEKEIERFKNEGKELVIIDDWVLMTHKKLLNKLSHVYMMERDFIVRRNDLKKRDALSSKELKISDLPYALGFVKFPKKSCSYILNNGSIEDLDKQVAREYSKYISPTFDERYKIVDSKPLANIDKAISSVKICTNKNQQQEGCNK